MTNRQRHDECRGRFGAAVCAQRLRRGLSQEELSFRCRLNRAHVSLIERGRREVRLTTICALAAGLGISVSELMRTVPPIDPPAPA